MKVFVVGASNAIGPAAFPVFLDAELKARDPEDQVINRPIGASTSAAGLYSFLVSRDDAVGTEVSIVDFEINDTGHMAQGLTTQSNTREIIVALLAGLRSVGSEPIVAVLPSRVGLSRPTIGEKVEIAAAEELAVYRINLSQLFRRLHAEGLPADAFMRDSSHMNLATTPIIGRIFAKLARFVASHPLSSSPVVPATPARAIPAASFAHSGALVTRSTSLRTSRCARVIAGDDTWIPVAPEERLVSLALNVGAHGAVVEFSNGVDRVVKQLVYCWFPTDPDRPLVMCADFHDGLAGGPNGISVRILPEGTPVTERTGHQMEPRDGRYGAIEIEGALVLGPAAQVPAPASKVPSVETDLAELVDLSDEVAELRALVPA